MSSARRSKGRESTEDRGQQGVSKAKRFESLCGSRLENDDFESLEVDAPTKSLAGVVVALYMK